VTNFTTFRPNDGGLWVDTEPSFPTDIEVERILVGGPRFEKMCKRYFFLYLHIQMSFYDSFAAIQYACGRHFHSIRLWKLFSGFD
jgi:hypothetical protein